MRRADLEVPANRSDMLAMGSRSRQICRLPLPTFILFATLVPSLMQELHHAWVARAHSEDH